MLAKHQSQWYRWNKVERNPPNFGKLDFMIPWLIKKKRRKKNVSPHQSVPWLGNVGPTSVEGWDIYSSTILLEVLQKMAERWRPVSIFPYPWVLKIPENCKAEKELRVVHCLLRNVPQNKALKLETWARRNLQIAILKKRKLKDSYVLISKSIIKL